MVVRVLCWNIHKGIGGLDRKYQLGRTIGVFEELRPDVALLQEVSFGLPRTRHDDQFEILREASGLPHGILAPQHRFRYGGYGNVILSRWPLEQVVHTDLTIGGAKRRGASHATTTVSTNGTAAKVVFTTLHLGLRSREREQQMQRLLRAFQEHTLSHLAAIVLGGDLNDVGGNLGERWLHPHGFSRAGVATATFPAILPMQPLDGLFVRGSVKVLEVRAPRTPAIARASDHLPILADLQLPHHDSRPLCAELPHRNQMVARGLS